MDSTIVEEGGRIASNEVARRAPGWWGGQLFGVIPIPLVWNFLTVLLVALIFWWLLRSSHKNVESAMNVLKKRYVSGEIDRKTYLQMKEDIKD